MRCPPKVYDFHALFQPRLVNYAIAEHIENAGVHSGDASLLLPAQRLFVETHRKVKSTTVGYVAADWGLYIWILKQCFFL